MVMICSLSSELWKNLSGASHIPCVLIEAKFWMIHLGIFLLPVLKWKGNGIMTINKEFCIQK